MEITIFYNICFLKIMEITMFNIFPKNHGNHNFHNMFFLKNHDNHNFYNMFS